MHVELRDEARDDLVDGAIFYGEQSADLDQHFLKCLRQDIEKLQSTGGIHEQYRGSTDRCQNVFLSPYTIWFLESVWTWSQSWIAEVIQQRSILDADEPSHEAKSPIQCLLTSLSTSATA